MSEQFPAVASSLLVGDKVGSLAPEQRRFFTGSCAESASSSNQLWAEFAREDGRTTAGYSSRG